MHKAEYLEKLKTNKELQDIEWFQCVADPKYFILNWVQTLDTHDPDHPIKGFPDKEYVKILIDIWHNTNLLLVPKSRQMMISWLFVALYLWDTMFHEGRLTFFQSKKEDDADDLIKRAKFMWDYLPGFLKRYRKGDELIELRANPQNRGLATFCKITFPDINSEIRGIPQGGDVIRMHTASGILSDEMAFQPEASDAYTAAKPTISGKHARFTGVSTAEDNTFFEEMVFDKLEM